MFENPFKKATNPVEAAPQAAPEAPRQESFQDQFQRQLNQLGGRRIEELEMELAALDENVSEEELDVREEAIATRDQDHLEEAERLRHEAAVDQEMRAKQDAIEHKMALLLMERCAAGNPITPEHQELIARDLVKHGKRSAFASEALKTQGFEKFEDALEEFKVETFQDVELEKKNALQKLLEFTQEAGKDLAKSGAISLAAASIVTIVGGTVAWPAMLGAVVGGVAGKKIAGWWARKDMNGTQAVEQVGSLITTAQNSADSYLRLKDGGQATPEQLAAAQQQMLGNMVGSLRSQQLDKVAEYRKQEGSAKLWELLGGLSGGALGGAAASTYHAYTGAIEAAKEHGVRLVTNENGLLEVTNKVSEGHMARFLEDGWNHAVRQEDLVKASAKLGANWSDHFHVWNEAIHNAGDASLKLSQNVFNTHTVQRGYELFHASNLDAGSVHSAIIKDALAKGITQTGLYAFLTSAVTRDGAKKVPKASSPQRVADGLTNLYLQRQPQSQQEDIPNVGFDVPSQVPGSQDDMPDNVTTLPETETDAEGIDERPPLDLQALREQLHTVREQLHARDTHSSLDAADTHEEHEEADEQAEIPDLSLDADVERRRENFRELLTQPGTVFKLRFQAPPDERLRMSEFAFSTGIPQPDGWVPMKLLDLQGESNDLYARGFLLSAATMEEDYVSGRMTTVGHEEDVRLDLNDDAAHSTEALASSEAWNTYKGETIDFLRRHIARHEGQRGELYQQLFEPAKETLTNWPEADTQRGYVVYAAHQNTRNIRELVTSIWRYQADPVQYRNGAGGEVPPLDQRLDGSVKVLVAVDPEVLNNAAASERIRERLRSQLMQGRSVDDEENPWQPVADVVLVPEGRNTERYLQDLAICSSYERDSKYVRFINAERDWTAEPQEAPQEQDADQERPMRSTHLAVEGFEGPVSAEEREQLSGQLVPGSVWQLRNRQPEGTQWNELVVVRGVDPTSGEISFGSVAESGQEQFLYEGAGEDANPDREAGSFSLDWSFLAAAMEEGRLSKLRDGQVPRREDREELRSSLDYDHADIENFRYTRVGSEVASPIIEGFRNGLPTDRPVYSIHVKEGAVGELATTIQEIQEYHGFSGYLEEPVFAVFVEGSGPESTQALEEVRREFGEVIQGCSAVVPPLDGDGWRNFLERLARAQSMRSRQEDRKVIRTVEVQGAPPETVQENPPEDTGPEEAVEPELPVADLPAEEAEIVQPQARAEAAELVPAVQEVAVETPPTHVENEEIEDQEEDEKINEISKYFRTLLNDYPETRATETLDEILTWEDLIQAMDFDRQPRQEALERGFRAIVREVEDKIERIDVALASETGEYTEEDKAYFLELQDRLERM